MEYEDYYLMLVLDEAGALEDGEEYRCPNWPEHDFVEAGGDAI